MEGWLSGQSTSLLNLDPYGVSWVRIPPLPKRVELRLAKDAGQRAY